MLLLLTLMSCKKVTIDFTYSPNQPKAGEKVTFVNASSKGDEWLWRFGDLAVSSSKSPTHVYSAPGTYQVTLRVDDKDKYMCTHMITIVDTIPSYVSDHDSLTLYAFEDVTFSAQVYNPKNDSVILHWTAQPAYAVTVDSTGMDWKVYFAQAGKVEVTMELTLNGKTTTQTRSYTVVDKKTTAVLMQDNAGAMLRQRVFFAPDRAEEVLELTYAEGKEVLANMQDTLQMVNGYTYRLSELKAILPEMLGFRIAYGKVYFRTPDGLYIAGVQGDNINVIDSHPVSALYTDTYTGTNRLYWASATGVHYMPLVDHPLNQFDTTKIATLNNRSNILRLAVDTTYRYR